MKLKSHSKPKEIPKVVQKDIKKPNIRNNFIPVRRKHDTQRVAPFIEKLNAMLTNERFHDVISFYEDGNSFILHDPEKFTKEVLPKFFEHQRLRSFTRQLNVYGFKRCNNRGPNERISKHEYQHAQFIRGRTDLHYKIVRGLAKLKRTDVKKEDEKEDEEEDEKVEESPHPFSFCEGYEEVPTEGNQSFVPTINNMLVYDSVVPVSVDNTILHPSQLPSQNFPPQNFPLQDSVSSYSAHCNEDLPIGTVSMPTMSVKTNEEDVGSVGEGSDEEIEYLSSMNFNEETSSSALTSSGVNPSSLEEEEVTPYVPLLQVKPQWLQTQRYEGNDGNNNDYHQINDGNNHLYGLNQPVQHVHQLVSGSFSSNSMPIMTASGGSFHTMNNMEEIMPSMPIMSTMSSSSSTSTSTSASSPTPSLSYESILKQHQQQFSHYKSTHLVDNMLPYTNISNGDGFNEYKGHNVPYKSYDNHEFPTVMESSNLNPQNDDFRQYDQQSCPISPVSSQPMVSSQPILNYHHTLNHHHEQQPIYMMKESSQLNLKKVLAVPFPYVETLSSTEEHEPHWVPHHHNTHHNTNQYHQQQAGPLSHESQVLKGNLTLEPQTMYEEQEIACMPLNEYLHGNSECMTILNKCQSLQKDLENSVNCDNLNNRETPLELVTLLETVMNTLESFNYSQTHV